MKELLIYLLIVATICATMIVCVMVSQREETIRASFCPHIYEPAMSMPIAPRKK